MAIEGEKKPGKENKKKEDQKKQSKKQDKKADPPKPKIPKTLETALEAVRLFINVKFIPYNICISIKICLTLYRA